MSSQKYQVTVTIGHVESTPVFFSIILDYASSGQGTAVLSNFQYSGGSLLHDGSPINYTGSFSGGTITMGTNPLIQSQVMAQAVGKLTSFSFDIEFTGTPWWTFQMYDGNVILIESNLPNHPGLFGWVSGNGGWSNSPTANGVAPHTDFETVIKPA